MMHHDIDHTESDKKSWEKEKLKQNFKEKLLKNFPGMEGC